MYTTLIDVSTLRLHYLKSNWRVIDTRFSLLDNNMGPKEYTEGHIPGSIYANLENDLSGPITIGQTGRHPLPSVNQMVTKFSSWGIDKNIQVVVYDSASGTIAARLWWMLRWLGHEAVAVLDGGLPAWITVNLPISKEPSKVSARKFEAKERSDMVANLEKVEKYREDPKWALLDARTVERFRGEIEPIDPVAGHIPGARCASFEKNLSSRGTFETSNELTQRYKKLTGDIPPERIINYCGSGVTACHNILALAHAGIGNTVLFPGSWSEWITKESSPIATGE